LRFRKKKIRHEREVGLRWGMNRKRLSTLKFYSKKSGCCGVKRQLNSLEISKKIALANKGSSIDHGKKGEVRDVVKRGESEDLRSWLREGLGKTKPVGGQVFRLKATQKGYNEKGLRQEEGGGKKKSGM